jgi:CBS domain-containing protein/sporulation protein YlmC with PRC-barrel domain
VAVENALREIPGTNAQIFVYFSEIMGRLVCAADGEGLGRLADFKIKMGELFPRVASLAVKPRHGKQILEMDWSNVDSCNTQSIRLNPGAEKLFRPLETGPEEILLREELLDKQVVDTLGARIERVNDIHLIIVHQDLRLVHVDFGARGILRRLGWLRSTDKLTNWLFAYQTEERLISWKYIQPLPSHPDKRNLKLNVSARKLHEIHPSDLADIIEELDALNRSTIFRALDTQTAALTLEELDDTKIQTSLITQSPVEQASDILDEMAPDEATDLLADLPGEKRRKLIQTMEKPSREAVEALLKYREGTAGSIMTKDFFSVPGTATVGQAIEEFRKTTCPLESVAYIYIHDALGKIAGVCTLRHLIIAERDVRLSTLMNTRLITVEAEEKIAEVTGLFRKYKFLALPVVDAGGTLQGLITLKDIMQEELEE